MSTPYEHERKTSAQFDIQFGSSGDYDQDIDSGSKSENSMEHGSRHVTNLTVPTITPFDDERSWKETKPPENNSRQIINPAQDETIDDNFVLSELKSTFDIRVPISDSKIPEKRPCTSKSTLNIKKENSSESISNKNIIGHRESQPRERDCKTSKTYKSSPKRNEGKQTRISLVDFQVDPINNYHKQNVFGSQEIAGARPKVRFQPKTKNTSSSSGSRFASQSHSSKTVAASLNTDKTSTIQQDQGHVCEYSKRKPNQNASDKTAGTISRSRKSVIDRSKHAKINSPNGHGQHIVRNDKNNRNTDRVDTYKEQKRNNSFIDIIAAVADEKNDVGSRQPYNQQLNDKSDSKYNRHTRGHTELPNHRSKEVPNSRLRIDIHFLEDLAGKQPSQIAMTLASQNLKLKEAIPMASTDNRFLKLMLHVLAKAFICRSLPDAVFDLFAVLKETKFFDILTLHLLDFTEDVSATEKEEWLLKIADMITIMWEVVMNSPSAMDTFSRMHTSLGRIVERFNCSTDTKEFDIYSNYMRLTEYKSNLLKKQERNTKTDLSYLSVPPDDFRTVQVLPQHADIHEGTGPFIRANIAEGSYVDLDHYLDVQFRLLREDFTGPLREGIHELIQMRATGQTDTQLQDVQIYDNVAIGPPLYSEEGTTYCLQFEVTRRLAGIDWKKSKRLIYGSLVCLSFDNFSTFFFASVVDRDDNEIQYGYIKVRFEHERDTVQSLFGQSFTMLETSAFFESYRHVLTGLQSFRTDDLPFEDYIVHCKVKVKAPVYLNRNTKYDLLPLMRDTSASAEIPVHNKLKIKEPLKTSAGKVVNILDRSSWPTPNELQLDESQFDALHDALTKEFVIIQGPPGTGKTYIGLKIAKALLHNNAVWSIKTETGTKDKRPILVVCYTNHALDQFLEGILRFHKSGVLRVGGRSKNEALAEHNIRQYRWKLKKDRTLPRELREAKDQITTEFKKNLKGIDINTHKLEICRRYIVNEAVLKPYIGQYQYNSLTKARNIKGSNSYITSWLGIDHMKSIVLNRDNEEHDEDEIGTEHEPDFLESERYLDIGDEELQYENYERTEDRKKIRKETIAFFIKGIGENPEDESESEWKIQKKQRKKLLGFINQQLSSQDVMSGSERQKIYNVWRISKHNRWRLYRLWLHDYCDALRNKKDEFKDSIDAIGKRHRNILMQVDKEIMRKVTVIGMTTTGAAKYRNVLQEVKPRIIIVEEAAEVLEAHIITTLSSGCEHLILIGDHKQLKPSPTVYKLAVKYNLDLSLFERMIKNGLRFNCLELQHRMRPEIAEPLRYIYNNLRDHEDVRKYDDIRGIYANMFLINHKHHETADGESKSHSNNFEAEYAVALHKHLVLQGYSSSQITILATYSGQQFLIRQLDPGSQSLVTVVDNYQGEENDIIILSLVRSNVNGVIGFLKTENRICVALSRAKKGFYIIGNFDMLAAKSDLWKNIVVDMTAQKRFGEGLPMYCQNHPDDEGITAKNSNDFNKAPEGGCSKKCEARLTCGHVCRQFCHVLDKLHTEYQCQENCEEILCDLGHNCPKLCFQDCGNCIVQLTKTIPKCGHLQIVPCHVSPDDFSCLSKCERKLSCGHDCTEPCGESHTSKCFVIVNKTWSCGHSGKVQCYRVDTAKCPHPCNSELMCGHICNGTCGKCFNKRLHVPCDVNCKRILVCGHECTGKCDTCPPCRKQCENRCPHSKCTEHCGVPCTPCQMPCKWSCYHYRCTNRCSEPCNRPQCNKYCRKKLKCGHQCIGLCGEPCPPLCRVCHKDLVTTIIFGEEDRKDARFVLLEDCNHIIESRALDKYMSISNTESSESIFIKLKTCPYCSTPIRKNYRYGQHINAVLRDIESVKRNIFGNIKQEPEQRREYNNSGIKPLQQTRTKRENKRSLMTEQDEITQRNLRKMEAAAEKLFESLKTRKVALRSDKERDLVEFLRHMKPWCERIRYKISDQEQSDFQNEMSRCSMFLKFKQIEKAINIDKLTKNDMLRLKDVRDVLTLNAFFTDKMKMNVKEGLGVLAEYTKVEGLGITEDERIMIVKAINLTAGHWFKCPNNHVYAIGECGGATEEGQCPECEAKIGGKQHTLVQGNKLAREMDGATYAAYSEEANNMGNFDLDIII